MFHLFSKHSIICTVFLFFSLLSTCILQPSAETTTEYNDTYYDKQWWVSNMNLPTAWKQSGLYTTKPVIIAVIDTGVYHKHKDLAGHIWTNQKEIPGNHKDDDKNGYVDDYYGWDFYNNDASLYSTIGTGSARRCDTFDNDNHGTHVAGLLAATANNQLGIAGVASNINIQIMCLKVFGGVNGSGSTSSLMKAIRYAEAQGASIVNASWNFNDTDTDLKTAIAESNMLFVCSAGNNSKNLDFAPSYPCCYSLNNVVSVTSIDENNNFCDSFANYGASSIHLAAPGKNIISTVIGGYETLYGTSMSTPMVTGTAALVYAANPALSAKDLKKILLASTNTNPNLATKTITGGQIDATKAVALASTYKPVKDKTKPAISCIITRYKKSVKCKVTVTDKGGSGLRLIRYAKGKRKISYFKKGQTGNPFFKKTLTFKKNCKITIYALDHQGNERVKTVTLKKKQS